MNSGVMVETHGRFEDPEIGKCGGVAFAANGQLVMQKFITEPAGQIVAPIQPPGRPVEICASVFTHLESESFNGCGKQQRMMIRPIDHGSVEIDEILALAELGEQSCYLLIVKNSGGHPVV